MTRRLEERKLSELSKIDVRFFTGNSAQVEYCKILVIQFIGTYPIGSEGNDDAQFMCAMAKAGIEAFEADGVIYDLSQLHYEWGDRLEMLFAIGPPEPAGGIESIFGKMPRAQQAALVVGPSCEEAVRTLLLGENSDDPIEKIGWVFRDQDSAWLFIENQLAKTKPNAKSDPR